MIIKNITIRNLKSFGNAPQKIDLWDNGNLILLSGRNGAGKCVDKKTHIDIEINDLQLSKDLILYLETTEAGKRFLLYIKETNIFLYEKIKDFKAN